MILRAHALLMAAFILLTASIARAQESDAEVVRFTRRPLAPGWSVSKRTEMRTLMQVEVRSEGEVVQKADQEDESREAFRYEVLEADEAGRPTRVRAAFGELVQARAINDMRREQTNVLSGREFVVSRKNGELTVVSSDESSLKPAMVQLVRQKVGGSDGRLALVGRFQGIIPEGPMTVGTKLNIPPEDAAAIMSTPVTYSVRHATLKLRGTSERDGAAVAVFDLTTTIEGQTGRGTPELVQSMKGRIEVGIDTLWLHRMVIDGDIRLNTQATLQDGRPTTSRGEGTVRFEGTARFAPIEPDKSPR